MSDNKFAHTPVLAQEDAAMPYQPDQTDTAARPGRQGAAADAWPASTMPSGRLEAARRRNERALMAIDGVEGVALGRHADGRPAIVLYVHDDSVRQRLPRLVDGFPVLASVTGQIDIV